MQKKYKIAICVGMPAILIMLAVALFFPWFKIGESTCWTCPKCKSNREIHVDYGKWNVETNRQEVITFRGLGFESCHHDWVPGQTTTNSVPKVKQEVNKGSI